MLAVASDHRHGLASAQTLGHRISDDPANDAQSDGFVRFQGRFRSERPNDFHRRAGLRIGRIAIVSERPTICINQARAGVLRFYNTHALRRARFDYRLAQFYLFPFQY